MSWPVNADFMRDTNKAELGKLQCSKLVPSPFECAQGGARKPGPSQIERG